MKKRILSALLATIMLFGMMPMVTFAQAEEMPMLTTTYVNPVYDSVLSPEEISIDVSSPAMLSAPVYHTDPSTTAAEMRAALESRAAEVTIGYQIPKNSFNEETLGEITDGIFEAAYAHTGVPTQGDYLRWHFAYCGISAMSSGTNLDGTIWYTDLTFHLEYYTTQEQEEAVAARVDSLLAELNPTGTDYEKIKTVYDWMCENIVYDYANLNDPTYDLKYSAYAALINGTSVCQGYSNLLYRMALEMGIDCRIITGWGNGGNHAWNIIKLGDSYYNLDATWDSTFAQAGRKNQFFLRSEANFGDHVRSPECDTAAFHAAYPMGKTDYDPKQNVVEDENIIASGTCGENLTWVLDTEGTLTISGTGAMENYREGYRQTDSPWYDYREVITNVVIENGVTTIGSYAFDGCTSLANVTIGNGVTSIGTDAFSYCSSLTSITIPESVTDIQDCAFQGCSSLTNITIPEGITWIGKSLFSNCDSLTSITIPTSVEIICYSAFSSCDSLTSIVIPENMAIVENWAFAECTSLSEITFLGDAPEIGEDVFLEVTATAYYPANNPTWTADVMQNYGGIITWTPVGGEPDVDENIIASGTCDEFLTWTLDENGTLTISGEGLMEDFGRQDTAPWYEHREAIKKVVIKDGVTSIGSLAFLECVNLAEIEIADTVTDIELGAFWDCDSLVSIVIPNSVTAMENCFHTKLQSITLSNNLTKIDQGMFANCTELTSIVIPEGVTSLEKGVFFGCKNLKSVTLPSTLTNIGCEVFYGCTSLTEVTLPENLTRISDCSFQSSGLTSIKIPASVTQIWEYAFDNCLNLTGIWVDEGNENYSSDASGALLDKEQKTLLQVPGGLTGKYEIPDGVTSVEGWALSFCAKLTEVTIPDSVDTIGNGAFYGCAELKSVIVPAGISMIDEAVFSGCTNLTAVVIPDTVAEIREWAFDECDRLWHVLFNGTEDQWNSIAIAKNNTALKKATCHYNAKGDEVIAVNKTTCTEKIFCECTICGAVLAETISGGAHTWDNGVVTKEPTEETVGVRTYTCVTCGETKTEEIPALEHTHVFVTGVTAPTCTEGGYTTHTCACGEEVLTDVTDPLGHKLAYTIQTQPTVEADGILAGSCERCDHKTEEVLPKLNKTEYTYEVTKQPTTGETGIGRYTWTTEYGTFFFEVTLDKLPEQPEIAFGDTDGNGRIQTNDAKLILQHIVRMPVELNLDAADVDGNGKIQTNDAKLILQYIVKIITQFPAQNQ